MLASTETKRNRFVPLQEKIWPLHCRCYLVFWEGRSCHMKFGEKLDTWINLDIHDYNWPVYRSLFLFSFHQQKILKKVEHSWNMKVIRYIHLQFCNIRTDFHFPSPKNLKKWRPVDITGLRWVLNQMVGPIMQPSAWTISVVGVLSADVTDAAVRSRDPGRPKHTKLWETVDEFELLKLHPYSSLNYSNSADFTTATQNAFFIQSMGSFGRVKFAPFSYITLNLFICAKFVTSCRSLTTREQARSLYPRTPAHTRIVSWKHLSGFKLYSLYAWSFSPSKKCSNKNHDNKNFLHSTTVPFGSTWIKWYVRFMKWQDHLRFYSLQWTSQKRILSASLVPPMSTLHKIWQAGT